MEPPLQSAASAAPGVWPAQAGGTVHHRLSSNSLRWSTAACSLCSGPGNLPTDTDLVVAVAADPAWLEGQGLNMTELRTIVTSALRKESCQQQFATVTECAYLNRAFSLPC